MPSSPLQSRHSEASTLSDVPDAIWDFLRAELDAAVFGEFGASARIGFTDTLVACAFARHLGHAVRPMSVTAVIEHDRDGPAIVVGQVDADSLATIEASRLAVCEPALGLQGARASILQYDWAGFLRGQRQTQTPLFPDGSSRHIVLVARNALFDPGLAARVRWRVRLSVDRPAVAPLDRMIGLARGRWVVAHLPRIGPSLSCFWLSTGERAIRRGDPAADHRAVRRAAHRLATRYLRGAEPHQRPLAEVLGAFRYELGAEALRNGGAQA
ncbi:MAG: hypothetical protein HY059_12745 [Proteobacteria bacterium]|nr:hypothetical protein [Pseudomonadota bacterium]